MTMQAFEIRRQLEQMAAPGGQPDIAQLRLIRAEWEKIKTHYPEGYWPIIEDRLRLLERGV